MWRAIKRTGASNKCVLWVMKSRWGAFVPSSTTLLILHFCIHDRENRRNEGDGKGMTGRQTDRQTDRGEICRARNTNGYANATWKDVRLRERRIWSLGFNAFQLFSNFVNRLCSIDCRLIRPLVIYDSFDHWSWEFWRYTFKYWWRARIIYKVWLEIYF